MWSQLLLPCATMPDSFHLSFSLPLSALDVVFRYSNMYFICSPSCSVVSACYCGIFMTSGINNYIASNQQMSRPEWKVYCRSSMNDVVSTQSSMLVTDDWRINFRKCYRSELLYCIEISDEVGKNILSVLRRTNF